MSPLACSFMAITIGFGLAMSENASISKRFFLGDVLAGEVTLAYKAECITCKCTGICVGELVYHFNETAICGSVWNTVNCTDKHNKQENTTSLPATELPTTTTTTIAAPTKPRTTAPPTVHPIQEIFCANVHSIRCGTDLSPICGSNKLFYLNKCEYSKAVCEIPDLKQMDISFCSQ